MAKKIIDILIIVGLFVGFYFISAYFFTTSDIINRWTFREQKKESTLPMTEEEKRLQGEKDVASYNEAIASRSKEGCMAILDLQEQKTCLDMVGATLALDARDREMCRGLSASGIVVRCQDNVAYALSLEKKDKNICTSISDENIRMSCIESLEKSLFEIATASGTLTKDLCETFETSLKTKCERTIMTKDDTSIYRDAITTKSLSSCDAITDESTRSQCRDTLLFQEAVTTSDISLCAKISDTTKSSSCTANLEARADALSFAKLVTSGTLSDCQTLRSEKYQNQCHDMVIIRTVTKDGDTALCDMLYATGMIDRCQKMSGK